MRRSSLIVAAFLIMTAAVAAEELPFELPIPDGWRTETIPFPLGFAPELEYEGLEELRFAPGMFDAEAEDFWTYAFVWWITADAVPGPDVLAADLVTYFDGLVRAVAEGGEFDPGDVAATVRLAPAPAPFDHGESVEYLGTATTVDAFVTHEPVTLNVRVRWVRCPDDDRLAVIFEFSPQPHGHHVWRDLIAIRDGFRCRE